MNYIKTPSNSQGASPISSHLHVTSGASTSMIPPLVTIKCFSCGKWPWPGGKPPKNAGKTRFPAGKLICKWGTGGIWKNQTGWTWWLKIEPTQMGNLWEIYDKCLLVYNWLTTVGFWGNMTPDSIHAWWSPIKACGYYMVLLPVNQVPNPNHLDDCKLGTLW